MEFKELRENVKTLNNLELVKKISTVGITKDKLFDQFCDAVEAIDDAGDTGKVPKEVIKFYEENIETEDDSSGADEPEDKPKDEPKDDSCPVFKEGWNPKNEDCVACEKDYPEEYKECMEECNKKKETKKPATKKPAKKKPADKPEEKKPTAKKPAKKKKPKDDPKKVVKKKPKPNYSLKLYEIWAKDGFPHYTRDISRRYHKRGRFEGKLTEWTVYNLLWKWSSKKTGFPRGHGEIDEKYNKPLPIEK